MMKNSSSLRMARTQRGWSQARLAALVGTSTLSISRWERGTVLPSPYFREKLCTLFEQDARALGFISQAIEVQPRPTSLYDPLLPTQILPSTGLVGREAILQSLTEELCSASQPSTFTLYGLPGVGKTTLLIALTQIPEIKHYFSDGILWAGLGPHPHLLEHLSRWGSLLQIPQEELQGLHHHPALAKALRSHIGSRRLLLVIDDIWKIEDALTLQVGGVNCTHLITTRFPNIAAQISMEYTLRVSELQATEGKTLLTHFLPNLAEQEPETIEQLAQDVGMLPLALTLIGKHLYPYDYLQQTRRLHTELQHLRDRSTRMHLSRPQSLVEHHPSIPPEQPLSLETVIAVSIHYLSPAAQKTLQHLAMLPAKPNSFSDELVTALTPDDEEVLNDLIDAGLVESYDADRYTIHQTIVDYASTMNIGDQEQAKIRLITYNLSWISQHSEDYELIDYEYRNLLTALEIAIQHQQQDAESIQLVHSLMPFWLVRGWYSEANRFLQQTLLLGQKRQDHKAEIYILQSLGDIAERQANNEQAKAYYQKGMDLVQQTPLRTESIPFLKGLNVIECRYGNYEQAEKYCRTAIAVAQQAGDHKQLSMLLTHLGIVLDYQNRIAEAEATFKEALPLAQQTGQQELIIRIYNGLGALASLHEFYDEAEAYYQKGMKLSQAIGHQELTLRLLNGLGVISSQRGDHTQAYRYYQKALLPARQIGSRSLTCNILFNLGKVSELLKTPEQASTFYRESLELSREINYQCFIALDLAGLGEIELAKHHYPQAGALFLEALDCALSNDFEATSRAFYGLARIEDAQKNKQKAIEYGKKSVEMHDQIPHHKTNEIPQWFKNIKNSL